MLLTIQAAHTWDHPATCLQLITLIMLVHSLAVTGHVDHRHLCLGGHLCLCTCSYGCAHLWAGVCERVCVTRRTYTKWYSQKSCGPGQGLNETEKQRERNKSRDGIDADGKTDQHRENKQISLTHFGFPQHLAQSLVNSQCLVKNKSCMEEKDAQPKRR